MQMSKTSSDCLGCPYIIICRQELRLGVFQTMYMYVGLSVTSHGLYPLHKKSKLGIEIIVEYDDYVYFVWCCVNV